MKAIYAIREDDIRFMGVVSTITIKEYVERLEAIDRWPEGFEVMWINLQTMEMFLWQELFDVDKNQLVGSLTEMIESAFDNFFAEEVRKEKEDVS